MAADALEDRDGRLAELSPETLARLEEVAPRHWSGGNPVDILGDTHAPVYSRALEILLEDPAADAVLVMNCPTAVEDSTAAADAVVATLKAKRYHRPVLSAWLGQTAVAEGRRRLAAAGVPAHETPDEAVQAFMHLVNHRRNQQALIRTPSDPAAPPDLKAAQAVIAAARADDRLVLTPEEGRALLSAYGVPVLESRAGASPDARELLVGLAQDPLFGPIVMFGAGGIGVDVIGDRVVGLPPLDDVLAADLISRTRIHRLLEGYRGHTPADVRAIADVIARLSQIAIGEPDIAELEINPLLADASGVGALDVRVRLQPKGEARPRMAILPYPLRLQREIDVGGEKLLLRPIRPQDGPAVSEMVEASSAEDVRLRFRSGFRTLPPGWPERLSQIDYDREMALVAVDADGRILGVSRLAGDPQGETAEFALMVRTDQQHQGLGRLLLREILDYAAARGLREVWGDVARENAPMLATAKTLGFERRAAEDFTRVKIVKTLLPAVAEA